MKNTNTANNNEVETTKQEKKTAHTFFTRSTLNQAQHEFKKSTPENDAITPFYVLGYN